MSATPHDTAGGETNDAHPDRLPLRGKALGILARGLGLSSVPGGGFMRTLPELVEEFTRSSKEYFGAFDEERSAVQARFEQLAAASADVLKSQFDVDLSDPETARVAGIMCCFINQHGRANAGVLNRPASAEQAIHYLAGQLNAMNGIITTIAARHGEAT